MGHQDPAERPQGRICVDLAEAPPGAERLISRMQDTITPTLLPQSGQKAGLAEPIGDFDPAPEGRALRQNLRRGPETGARGRPAHASPARDELTSTDALLQHQTWRTGPMMGTGV